MQSPVRPSGGFLKSSTTTTITATTANTTTAATTTAAPIKLLCVIVPPSKGGLPFYQLPNGTGPDFSLPRIGPEVRTPVGAESAAFAEHLPEGVPADCFASEDANEVADAEPVRGSSDPAAFTLSIKETNASVRPIEPTSPTTCTIAVGVHLHCPGLRLP